MGARKVFLRMMVTTLAILLFLTLTFQIQVGCGTSNSVVFIYSTDLNSAESFKSLLESHRLQVDLVSRDKIVGKSFSAYELVIVGNDTGWWGYDPGQLKHPISTPNEMVKTLNASGIPILGLGLGGSCFFSVIGLSIGWAHAWDSAPQKGVWVVNSAHPIFNQPVNLGTYSGGELLLYSSVNVDLAAESIYMPNTISGVTPLGRDLQDHDHYPLIAQGNRFFLWGFTNSASDMTGTGRDLFFNVVTWLGGIEEEGDQAWSILDLRFLLVISLFIIIVIVVSALLLPRRKHSSLKNKSQYNPRTEFRISQNLKNGRDLFGG